MPLIYITGSAGSGKSTVRKELVRLGYTAYDVDEDKLKAWYDKKTNVLAEHQKPWEESLEDRNWRQNYLLKVERHHIEEIAKAARGSSKPVFVTGVNPNDNEIWDLFDKVIHLSVSNETLEHRLEHRTSKYGKHPDDRENILKWNKTIDSQNEANGAVIVNAEQPLDQIIKDILRIAEED